MGWLVQVLVLPLLLVLLGYYNIILELTAAEILLESLKAKEDMREATSTEFGVRS